MPTKIVSCGLRHGKPAMEPDAILVDVRSYFGRNPFHNKKLRSLRGDHPDVIADIKRTPYFIQKYAKLRRQIEGHAGPVYLACTGGHHRSVFLANSYAQEFGCPVLHLNYDDK